MKPRILMLVDRRGWAFDICARGLTTQLADRYTFDIAYVREKPQIEPSRYDLCYVYFWGEDYLDRFDPDPERVIKEISSHRWQSPGAFGPLTPAEMVDNFLADAATRIATSQRLHDLLVPHAERVFYCPNGFREDLFAGVTHRGDSISIGWVGNPSDPAKQYEAIIEPMRAMGIPIAIADGDLPHEALAAFYRGLDVLLVSSESEGTPLPLLEAMACGCFPVCTDVGVVPEVVEHGRNGMIVAGQQRAFEDALEWCARNLERVRDAGDRNAREIARSRSWSAVAARFDAVFEETLAWVSPRAAYRPASKTRA